MTIKTVLFSGLVIGLAILAAPLILHANPAHKMLSGYSYEKRNLIFTEMLKESNERCGNVVRNFFQGFAEGDAFWNVACSNKRSLIIRIKNDRLGSTRIMDCGFMKLVAKVECFKKLK